MRYKEGSRALCWRFEGEGRGYLDNNKLVGLIVIIDLDGIKGDGVQGQGIKSSFLILNFKHKYF